MKSSISVGGALLFSNSGPLASILLTFRIQIVFHFFPPQYGSQTLGEALPFLCQISSLPQGDAAWCLTEPWDEGPQTLVLKSRVFLLEFSIAALDLQGSLSPFFETGIIC